MTTENVEERLKKYNLHLYGSKYTSKANYWGVLVSITFVSIKSNSKLNLSLDYFIFLDCIYKVPFGSIKNK
jgi:hypothetical protein